MPAIETAGCMFLENPSELLWQILTGCSRQKSYAALALCAALQGCALIQNEQAMEAESALIGRRRAEIMACAGIPDQVSTTGAKETATYSAAARHLVGGAVFGQGQCTVSFVFENGRVSEVNYPSEDAGSLTPRESCAEIVAPCLR